MVNAFPEKAEIVWCQEEPENMGGWSFIEPRLRKLFEREIAYAGRDASASPAVGSLVRHKREQPFVVTAAFKVRRLSSRAERGTSHSKFSAHNLPSVMQ